LVCAASMPSTNLACRPSSELARHPVRFGIDAAPTVAIVGGGFSGIMAAGHLLRGASERAAALRVVVIERSPGFEAGAAYRTDSTRHVLNVPCARMSAYPDDPEHFLRWLRRSRPDTDGKDFVPRGLYRAYLRDLLDEAASRAAHVATLEWIAAEAVDVVEAPDADGARVVLDDGSAIDASSVVLAIGNLPPALPAALERFRDSSFYVRDPWRGLPLAIEPDEPVLLIGSGLTMLDYALALDEQGHRGSIDVVSRHGLLPEGHLGDEDDDGHTDGERQAIVTRALQAAGFERKRTARGLLHAARVAIADAADRGVAWQHVIAAVRGQVAALWQACPAPERARFLRHVRRYWDVARHRAAPVAIARLAALRGAARVTVHAGEVRELVDDEWGVTAILRERGSHTKRVLRSAAVVNCTGPETRVTHADHPLLRALLRRGLLHADTLGLGVESTADGFAIRADGCVWPRLAVLGALNRARLWESTAVEELRVQASQTAAVLVGCLLPPRSRAAAA
jgi:uncharacterized NAD(P)/FAD-binding protein YdhS